MSYSDAVRSAIGSRERPRSAEFIPQPIDRPAGEANVEPETQRRTAKYADDAETSSSDRAGVAKTQIANENLSVPSVCSCSILRDSGSAGRASCDLIGKT